MIQGASPAFGAGAVDGGCAIGALYGTFTTSTGAFSQTRGPAGFTLGSFTSGVATLTFPTHLKFLYAFGHHNTDSATEAARHSLVVRDVDLTLGTATVRLVQDDSEAEDADHSVATGILKLVLIIGE
jgi:hypothetical protein